MDDQGSIEKISEYLRLILPLMTQHRISVTPENYSIWYKYVSGVDSELRRTIDTMLARGAIFSPKVNEELFKRFCPEKSEAELRRIRQDLHLVLTAIHQQLVELSDHAEEYESFVSDSIALLSENAPLQDIRSVVREIIDKTKKLGTFSKTLKHKVHETERAMEDLRKDFEKIRTEAFVDFLTGVANRKAFDETLTEMIGETAADKSELSMLLIDIDHFKRFNDTYGHLTGDEVLKFVAKKIKESVRGRDFVARFGGEEFAVLLPRTSLTGAESVAENIRNFFAQAALKMNSSSRTLGILTVSIGVSCHRQEEPSEQLVRRCDQALYSAKRIGRNRVISERDASINYKFFLPA